MATKPRFVNEDVLRIFPWTTPKGRVIVDEQCSCGHNRSNHGNTLAPGHGECLRDDCNCRKFTWTEMVFGRTRKR